MFGCLIYCLYLCHLNLNIIIMKEDTFKVIIRYYKEQYTIEKKIKALRLGDAKQLAESMYGDGGNNVTITVI